MPGTATVVINGNEWSVNVANTTSELIAGLSGVASIPAGTGMLFILPARQVATVQTNEMLFLIDIIFIKDNTVLSIASNIEPGLLVEEATPCDGFLEVNALEAALVNVGDIVDVEITTEAPVGFDFSSIIAFAIPLALLGFVFGMLPKGSSSNPGKGTVRLVVIKVPETDEYKVRWMENGKYSEAKSYYTNDYQDALDTLRAMENEAIRMGYKVKVEERHHSIPKGLYNSGESGSNPGPPKKVTVICSICSKEIVVEGYNSTTRSEALRKHIEEQHSHHSIHGEPRRRLVEQYGTWAVGRAEAVCPEDDIACVTKEAERLMETIRGRYGEAEYVTIKEPGATVFHPGDTISIMALERENKRMRELGEKEATYK